MLRIAICDDSPPITSEIESLLLSISQHTGIRMITDIYFDGKSLYSKISSGLHYDLIYMDIEMECLDGIQAARLIRTHKLPTVLIYVSSYDTYFSQLFEVEAFRFLPKPIDKATFDSYFFEAYERINQDSQFFTFSFRQEYYKVPISNIIYFESRGRDVYIHTAEKTYRFISKLNVIEQSLIAYRHDFLRIHQSYLINPTHIKEVSLTSVTLTNNLQIKIGPKFRSEVHKRFFSIIEDW